MNPGGDARAKRAAAAAFAIAALGGVTAGISDLVGVDTFPSLSGIGLALALSGTGFGLVAWAKYVGFDEHAVEQRERLTMTDEERDTLADQLEESRQELYNLRFEHATGTLENPAALGRAKRDIARLLTLFYERADQKVTQ